MALKMIKSKRCLKRGIIQIFVPTSDEKDLLAGCCIRMPISCVCCCSVKDNDAYVSRLLQCNVNRRLYTIEENCRHHPKSRRCPWFAQSRLHAAWPLVARCLQEISLKSVVYSPLTEAPRHSSDPLIYFFFLFYTRIIIFSSASLITPPQMSLAWKKPTFPPINFT